MIELKLTGGMTWITARSEVLVGARPRSLTKFEPRMVGHLQRAELSHNGVDDWAVVDDVFTLRSADLAESGVSVRLWVLTPDGLECLTLGRAV